MATRRPKSPDKAVVLVPPTVRQTYEQASVCVDVVLSAATLKTLQTLGDAETRDFFFGVSGSDDPEVALIVQSREKRRVHVTVEYRRRASSPFPKVPKARLDAIVRTLSEGEKFTFRHAERTTMTGPVDAKMMRPVELSTGRRVRLAAMEYDVVDEQDKPTGRGTRMRIGRDGAASMTEWIRSNRDADSFEAALILADPKEPAPEEG